MATLWQSLRLQYLKLTAWYYRYQALKIRVQLQRRSEENLRRLKQLGVSRLEAQSAIRYWNHDHAATLTHVVIDNLPV